jgi:valyl-tRNA synthetase
MDLESAAHELYGLSPTQFTAARNAKASEARKAGLSDVAASLRELRKPSTGAWLANLLVREQSKEVENLIELGDGLRAPKSKPEGQEIRKVSKEKVDVVSKLIRHAKSRASQLGHPPSASAVVELETTLDAAFADPQAAASLRQGRLTSGLRYSGLGFTGQPHTRSPSRTKDSGSGRIPKSNTDQITAQRNYDKAIHDAEQADAHVEKAKQAVKEKVAELSLLKSAEALAVRRSKEAHARASATKKQLSKRR